MSIATFSRRCIRLVGHRTWMIITMIIIILFLIILIIFNFFYFNFYNSNIKEKSFIYQTNCIINDIEINHQLCNNQQQKSCQLIIGECRIFNETQNITLYSTWLDYELLSSHQCTIDSCTGSQEIIFLNNQSLFSIYYSLDFNYGYLKKISKLKNSIAQTIFYLLIIFLIIIFIVLIILIFIFYHSEKYEVTIHPINSHCTSIQTQPSTIYIQKASKLTNDEYVDISMSLSTIATSPKDL